MQTKSSNERIRYKLNANERERKKMGNDLKQRKKKITMNEMNE